MQPVNGIGARSFASVDHQFPLDLLEVPGIWPFCVPYFPPGWEEGIAPCLRRVVALGLGRIEDVDITAELGRSLFPSEIYLNLWHNGISVDLVGVNTVGQSFFGSWVMAFDDEATNSIPALAVTGAYRPLSPLSAFDGQDAEGEWVVTIADYSIGDDHRLHGFTLRVTMPEPATLALLGLARRSRLLSPPQAELNGRAKATADPARVAGFSFQMMCVGPT